MKGDKAMTKGIVKKFDSEKGYGFITPDDGSKDVFVHFTAIDHEGYRELKKGDKVEFSIGEGRDGRPEAKNVKTI